MPRERGKCGEDAYPDEIVDDGGEPDRAEAVARREHRRQEADRPVKEQLRREEPEQFDGDGVFGRRRLAEGEQRDESGRGRDERDRRDDEDDAREGDNRRDRLDRFRLGARGQPFDEHRDEGRREHTSEDQVVHRVRRVVREVERVGKARSAERIGEHDETREPHQPGDDGTEPGAERGTSETRRA